ncbi:Sodium-independent sulfate anion transporter [Halotydeus destructor]|nr:Sodium-independent sulfate anion transporter [Halotydeus destructor]
MENKTMKAKKSDLFAYETIDGHDCFLSKIDDDSDDVYGLNITIDEEDEVSLQGCCSWCKQRFFTKEKLKRRLPIATWLPKYSFDDAKGDLVAGISVAFTIVPQGLALATLAGLPGNYGLYTSFMGCFVYAFFGTCKDAAVGPTSILAIMLAPYVALGGATYAILLSLFSGILMTVMGMLNLGFVVDFISFPVMSSFSTAAAVTIATSQLKGLFGLHYPAPRFLSTVSGFVKNIRFIHIPDTLMGLVCLAFLIPMQLTKDFKFKNAENSRLKRFFNGVWFAVVSARNAVVVIVTATVAMLWSDSDPFTLTSQIDIGIPGFSWPAFEVKSNGTVTKDFSTAINEISSGVLVISLIGLMETVAVAKAFMSSKKLDSTQEMIALGLCNFAGSFVGAFPAAGSISRSAVNHSSGVRTPLGGVVTGGLVLLALAFLANFFAYIPQTALSSVIIAAVIPMMRFDDFLVVLRSNKVDLIPYLATIVISLLMGLEFGIAVGVILSLIILLYQMARPRISIVLRMTPDGDPFLYVKPDRSIFFPSIEYMKVKLRQAIPVMDGRERSCIVIDGEHMFRSDSTFGIGIKNMVQSFYKDNFMVLFYNLRKPVLRAIRGSSLPFTEFVYCTSEDDVYSRIRSHCKSHRSTSSTPTGYLPSNPNHRYWASQSYEN